MIIEQAKRLAERALASKAVDNKVEQVDRSQSLKEEALPINGVSDSASASERSGAKNEVVNGQDIVQSNSDLLETVRKRSFEVSQKLLNVGLNNENVDFMTSAI